MIKSISVTCPGVPWISGKLLSFVVKFGGFL